MKYRQNKQPYFNNRQFFFKGGGGVHMELFPKKVLFTVQDVKKILDNLRINSWLYLISASVRVTDSDILDPKTNRD